MRLKWALWLLLLILTGTIFVSVVNSPLSSIFGKPSRGYFIEDGVVKYTYVAWPTRYVEALIGADTNTFQILDAKRSIAVDKNHVYFGSTRLDGAHPPSFQEIAPLPRHQISGYWKDNYNVYRYSKKLKGADPNSFKLLNPTFAIDNNQVYVGDASIRPCDIKSFRFIGPDSIAGLGTAPWWRDHKCLYKGRFKIEFADLETLEIINLNFAKDLVSVIGGIGIPTRRLEIDLKTVKAHNMHYAIDKNGCHFRGKLEACPETKRGQRMQTP